MEKIDIKLKKELLSLYQQREKEILEKLQNFKNLPEEKYKDELIFCILTPQSKAKKCWQAVEQLKKLKNPSSQRIKKIIRKHSRFHNRKTAFVVEALKNWDFIKKNLQNENRKDLRNWLATNVKGLGLKESSHFLRNIGKSDNQIAILDRHILRNLQKNKKIKNKNHYLHLENEFLKFSQELKIQPDALDLLLWGKETGEIFK